MKQLTSTEVKTVTGGLAYTGGDYQEYLRLMEQYPYLLNV